MQAYVIVTLRQRKISAVSIQLYYNLACWKSKEQREMELGQP